MTDAKDAALVSEVAGAGIIAQALNSAILHTLEVENGTITIFGPSPLSLLGPFFTVDASVGMVISYVIAFLLGLPIVILGILMYVKPNTASRAGAVVIVLSVAALGLGGSDFLFGFILGLIGGVLGLRSGPAAPSVSP